MTDEELAEGWVTDNTGFNPKEPLGKIAIRTFLGGLKVGRPKWHDLRNNPNDLPEPYTTVLDENSNKVEYIGHGKWQAYSEYYERYSEVDPPIAWCEIPKFEE